MRRGEQRSRGAFSGPARYNSRQTAPLKGLFADGTWHCNCTPRLPAEHFKVKKEGKNQGRWFYTCQQMEPKRCGFFLWDDDAKVREEAALIGGKRTEPVAQDGWNAGRDRDRDDQVPPGKGLFARNEQRQRATDGDSTSSASPPPSYRTAASTGKTSKRAAHEAALDDDDFASLGVSGEEGSANMPVTPHKVQKTGVYATPATTAKRKLPWLEYPDEAASKNSDDMDYFKTPSKAPAVSATERARHVGPQTPAAAPTPATADTPTPLARHRDALDDPADDSSSLTSEVLTALSQVTMPAEVKSKVRSILTKHDLRNSGVKKGRNVSRLALKAKDAKIVELQARIASLEADQEVERSLARMEKWESGQRGSWEG